MTRKVTAADIRRGHLRARRRHLRELIERLRSGCARPLTLEPFETWQLLKVLETVSAGRDTREWFGIKSATGPEPQHRGRDGMIAACFIKLRELQPIALEKGHRGRLARLTGLSDRTVRDIISGNAKIATAYAKESSAETLEITLRALLSAEGSPPNPTLRLFPKTESSA